MRKLHFFRKTTNLLSSCEVASADGLLNGNGNNNSGFDHLVSRQNEEIVGKVTEKKSCGTEMKH